MRAARAGRQHSRRHVATQGSQIRLNLARQAVEWRARRSHLQDEDTMPHAFGLDVEDRSCSVAGSLKPLAGLTLAEDRLCSARGRAAAAAAPDAPAAPAPGPGRAREQGGDQAPEGAAASGPAATEARLRDALLARLRFRRALHQVQWLLPGDPDAGRSSSAAAVDLIDCCRSRLLPESIAAGVYLPSLELSEVVAAQALEKLLGFKAVADLGEAAGHLQAAQAQLQAVRASAALGAGAGDPAVESCFDAAVNRPLMAPTPPRRMPVRRRPGRRSTHHPPWTPLLPLPALDAELSTSWFYFQANHII